MILAVFKWPEHGTILLVPLSVYWAAIISQKKKSMGIVCFHLVWNVRPNVHHSLGARTGRMRKIRAHVVIIRFSISHTFTWACSVYSVPSAVWFYCAWISCRKAWQNFVNLIWCYYDRDSWKKLDQFIGRELTLSDWYYSTVEIRFNEVMTALKWFR